MRTLMPLTLWAAIGLAAAAPSENLLADRRGWIQHGGTATSFHINKEGVLSFQQGQGEPSAILTREDFENFALTFSFRCHEWEESGLLIHAPWNGAWRAGLILALGDHAGDAPDVYRSGALLRHVAPKAMAVKAHGEWNDCAVQMNWPRIQVTLNGTLVQDVDLTTVPGLAHTLRRGRLGFLNNLGWGMEIRDLKVTRLPDTAGEIVMFNGTDLTGWKPVRNKRAWWTVENGAIRGMGGNGYLQYETPFTDFSLSLYYRASSSANGGVFFRWKSDDSDRGHEIQILDLPEVGMVSGSIYGLARGRDDIFRPGEWNLMQVFVKGSHATTYINGHLSAETGSLNTLGEGHITLQMHRDGSTIEWKGIVGGRL